MVTCLFCRELLEADITLQQDKVRQTTDLALTHVNAAIVELRRLFLIEDLVDSLKFGGLLWILSYVGSWFNGMTLVIIGELTWHPSTLSSPRILSLFLAHSQSYHLRTML